MGPIILPDNAPVPAPKALAKLEREMKAADAMNALRLQCLDLALRGSSANLGDAFVIERAQEFVNYVLNGPRGPKPPTLEDRLTQAFYDTGESIASV